MKTFLLLIIIIAVIIALFIYFGGKDIKSDVEVIRGTSKSERCAEFTELREKEDYTFSYGDRIRQIMKGC